MTEPTPDPDDPGEGLRTRPAPSRGAQVNSARTPVARGTVALDTSMPTNTTTNGHTPPYDEDHTPATPAAPYANDARSDTMHVDAASHGTALTNGAHGQQERAGTPARATNGHTANGRARNGHASNGRDAGGRDGRGQAAEGHAANGHANNGHGSRGHANNGHAACVGAEGLDSGGAAPRHTNAAPRHTNGGTRNGGLVGGAQPFTNGAYLPGDGARVFGNGSRIFGNGGHRSGNPAEVSGDVIEMAGNGSRESVTFGVGETAGVLPGDQRTFDDVEAGIVALWRQFGERREQQLRDRLVLHYAPLVKYVAGRVGTGLPAHVEVADLIQSGIFGLVDAIEKFEPERGLKFETYAMQRIRGAILDDLRAQDWVPRSVRGRAREVERALERLGAQLRRTPTDAELADELGLSLHELRDVYAQLQLTSVVALDELAAAGRGPTPLADILEDQEALDPVALLVDQDNRRQLAQAIAHLAERDRVVVTLYYFENLTLAEIGRVLGVTESRVCQLHTRAVLRLRAKLLEKTDA
jgi:RNA polymerase sigma factor FliA